LEGFLRKSIDQIEAFSFLKEKEPIRKIVDRFQFTPQGYGYEEVEIPDTRLIA
jgi:hypothetical protein